MNSDKPQDLNQIENKTLFFASRHAAFFRSLGRFVRKGTRIGRIKVGPKLVLAVLLVVSIAYILAPFQSKAGYSFQANYDDGSLDAYNALGSRTAGTDTSLPSLNASGYNSTNALSYSYDGTSTLKYATASNLPTDKGSIEMKFQKSAYGDNVDQDKGSMNGPASVVYDNASGYMYFLDGVNSRIVKTKIDGTGWQTFGSTGSGVGQFNFTGCYNQIPGGLAYDSSTGYIYIGDCNNNRIVRTKMDGSGWAAYGTNGSGVGQFSRPNDVDFDPATGYLYVADVNNSRIVKTKIDGSGWTTLSAGDNVSGVAYDPVNDYVYCSRYWNGKVLKSKMDGTSQTLLSGFSYPMQLDYDAVNDVIYVANLGAYNIIKTKIDGTGWTAFGSSGAGANQFSQPRGISFDSSTQMFYVADYGNNRIVKTQIDGTGWTAYGSYYNNLMKFNQSPSNFAYDPTTGFYFILDNTQKRIVRTKADGTGWTTFGSEGTGTYQFKNLASVTYDNRDGYLYILDSGYNVTA